jgi:hypothetical protein
MKSSRKTLRELSPHIAWLQEEQDEHGQGNKWKGNQEGKSD